MGCDNIDVISCPMCLLEYELKCGQIDDFYSNCYLKRNYYGDVLAGTICLEVDIHCLDCGFRWNKKATAIIE